MLRGALGGAVLVLLSAFFAYLLAPAVVVVRRRVRVGRRRRPISEPAAILLIYVLVFTPALFVWRVGADAVRRFVSVSAPAAVDRLFTGEGAESFGGAIERVPLPAEAREALQTTAQRLGGYLEREARATLADLIAAAPYAPWLAAIIVGFLCVTGFMAVGVPSAVSLGVAAGILELVPAIGPLTALLIASSQAAGRVLAVVVFLAALRVLQDYVIYPRLIRRGMHLSTPAVIATIWIGAVLGGAAGVILAIPVAGFLSVSFRHWREYRAIEQLVRSRGATRQSDTGC
jgi:predicted PurR-regulated permease PerM